MFTDSTLMSPDFDEEAYLRYALHSLSRPAEQKRLASCANAVREKVHKILSENAEDMLQQITAACRAQRDVIAVRQATSSLVSSTDRLRRTIQEPHRVINTNIARLRNTNTALNILLTTLRFIGLTKRLKEQLQHDLPHAARTLREVEELLQANKLAGVEVVDVRMAAVERAAATIRSKAHDMLRRENTNDASDVVTALQCFFTLGTLPRVLGTLMTEQKREVIRSLMREMDPQAIADKINQGGGGMVRDINARTREVLFSHLKSAFANTVRHTRIVVAVWRVLVKKVDHATNTPYIKTVEGPTTALGDYWHVITDKLCERLLGIQKRPNFLAALATDILQYRALLESFLNDMGDFLDVLGRLMEMDTVFSGRGHNGSSVLNKTSASAAVLLAVEQMKRVWLSQVTQDVNEYFAAKIMDRYRERLHHMLSKLQSITPTGSSRTTVNVAADFQRPQVPAASYALETSGYTTLATQDVMMYRQDSQSLSIVLDCICQSLDMFLHSVTEATGKWSLPPLPSVSGDVTALQMYHISISNARTLLGTNLAVLSTFQPEGLSSVGDHVTGMQISAGARETEVDNYRKEPALDTRQLVKEKSHQLAALTRRCRLISEQIVQPFFKSVMVLLLDSISMCVDKFLEQGAAGVGQLHSQMQHFMSNFYYLFDSQTPALDEHARNLTDSLLSRLIVSVVLVCPLSQTVQQHLISCLQQVSYVVLSLGPTNSMGKVGRCTLSLKGLIHQLTTWYSLPEDVSGEPLKEWHSVFATLPPVLASLLLLQRVWQPSTTESWPHKEMGVSLINFLEIVETILLEQLRANNGAQPQGPDNDGVGGSSAMTSAGEVMRVVDICFDKTTAVVSCEDTARGAASVRWIKELFLLLKKPTNLGGLQPRTTTTTTKKPMVVGS